MDTGISGQTFQLRHPRISCYQACARVTKLKLNSLDCLIRSAGTDGRIYIQPACRLAAEMPVL